MLANPARRMPACLLRWPIALQLSRSAQFALVTLAVPLIVLLNRPLSGDVFWDLSYARVVLANGHLPTADPFTFAPHLDLFVDAQWLAQLAYAAPYLLLGLPGVLVFNALTNTAAVGGALYLAWRRSGSPRIAAISVLMFLPTLLSTIEPRAQTLAYLPFMATYLLLQLGGERTTTLLALAAIEAVWANLHGSFFLGPLLTGVTLTGYLAERIQTIRLRLLIADRRVTFLVIAGLAQATASLVTPYGPQMYRYILELSGHPVMRAVSEWEPTRIDDPWGLQFFISLGLVIVVMGCVRRRRAPADLLMMALFGIMGISASRNIAFWALICPPIMAVQLADMRVCLPQWLNSSHTNPRSLAQGWILATVTMALIVGSLPWTRTLNPVANANQRVVIDTMYPVAAADFLLSQNVPGGHVLSFQPWGAYLDWALWPRYQLMVDCAIEVHPRAAWEDFMLINDGYVAWEELLDKYGVDVMLLSRGAQTQLITAVEQSPRWKVTFSDSDSMVYERVA